MRPDVGEVLHFSEDPSITAFVPHVAATAKEPLRRVPMMEPLRGTKAGVGDLIDASDTPAQLLAKLSVA